MIKWIATMNASLGILYLINLSMRPKFLLLLFGTKAIRSRGVDVICNNGKYDLDVNLVCNFYDL